MGLAVRVLGPLAVLVDEHEVALGGPKQRAVLALLVADVNQAVRVDALADALWGDRPPGQPNRSIQVYLSALRKALGAYGSVLAAVPGGYRLDLAPDQLDAMQFEALAEQGAATLRSGDPSTGAELLDQALDLWRGPAFDGLAEDALQAAADRLAERRLVAQERRAEAHLGLGRHHELLPELDALADQHPYRERLQAVRVLALYRCGRTADALEAYDLTRRRLDADLGLVPGPDLRSLHMAILRHDPSLAVEPAELRARRHLPAPATELVGRTDEVAAVVELLTDGRARLVTLTGPGGIGKTRIALQAAHELAAAFPDGVWFVGLAPLADPTLVASTIARTLGLDEGAAGPVPALVEHLRDRRLLLLCDNVEHVVDGAPVLAELLAAGAGVRVLATSRVALRLYGEHVRPVPQLHLEEEAVPLFHARAAAVTGPAVAALTDHQLVATMCQRLDRLPLAIELVAARAGELPLADLHDALHRRLDLATEGPRDLPHRQQTLRAAIAWSHRLLPAAEQQLLARLGVLADGFDAEAARAVAADVLTPGAPPATSAPTGTGEPPELTGLVRASMVSRRHGAQPGALAAEPGALPGVEPSYALLETIREYALEQLRAAGHERAARDAHVAHYLDLAERAEDGMRGPDQLAWTARAEAAHDNFRLALDRLDEQSLADPAARHDRLRLATALSGFWYRTGRPVEGAARLERALDRADDLPELLRARALHGLGILQSMRNLGSAARATFRASGDIFRRIGDTAQLARSLNSQGAVARDQGDTAEARQLLEESLALWRGVGDPSRVGLVLGNLGLVARDLGDLAAARALLTEGLAIDEEHANAWGAAGKTMSLAIVALAERDLDQARTLLARAAAQYAALGERHGLTEALDVAAWIASAGGQHHTAARWAGAAEAERTALGIPLGPHDAVLAERHLQGARAALGPAGYAAAWADGRTTPIDRALAEAALVAPPDARKDPTG